MAAPEADPSPLTLIDALGGLLKWGFPGLLLALGLMSYFLIWRGRPQAGDAQGDNAHLNNYWSTVRRFMLAQGIASVLGFMAAIGYAISPINKAAAAERELQRSEEAKLKSKKAGECASALFALKTEAMDEDLKVEQLRRIVARNSDACEGLRTILGVAPDSKDGGR